ncbi:MAG: glycosyltransferase family 4 protein [Candidatus Thiodiazotropha taylori]|nr:glycosyltransferase family 4 protein [Candidatus Thiodiazotropha taylori]
MKVLLLSRYPRLGASSRLRSYQYLPGLAENGIEVTVSPLFSEAYLEDFYASGSKRPAALLSAYWGRMRQLFKAGEFDLLWLEKELFPWMPAWVEQLLKRLGIRLLVDYDDAIFHRYDQSGSALVRTLLGSKIDRVMASATLVTAGNDYLAKRAEAAGAPRVMQLPTVLDVARYRLKAVSEHSPFTVGWIGSPTTAGYLDLLREPLASVAQKHPVRLMVVGAQIEPIEGLPVVCVDWSEAREAELIRQFDVGVMPLADQLWEKGKCGYKLIQYMASALPVIASPIGVNREIVEHGVDGYLAEDAAAWESVLIRLIESAPLRQEMGRIGRSKVEQHYSLSVMTARLVSAIRQSAMER